VESTRFQHLLLPIISPPFSEAVLRTSMRAKGAPLDWFEDLAALLRAATCEERVIAAVNRFVAQLRDGFVMGSGNP
jgi:hypothetical protein